MESPIRRDVPVLELTEFTSSYDDSDIQVRVLGSDIVA